MKVLFTKLSLFVLLLSVSGCYVSTWEQESYRIDEGIPLQEEPTQYGKNDYAAFRAGNIIFRAFLRPEIEGPYKTVGPFKLYVNAFCDDNSGSAVFIRSVETSITNVMGRHDVIINTTPYKFVFRVYDISEVKTNKLEWDTFQDPRPVPAIPKNGDRVSVTVNVLVSNSVNCAEKVIKYKFEPYIRTGKIRWITP